MAERLDILRVDYGWAGTVLILVPYLVRDSRALLFPDGAAVRLMTMPPEVLIAAAAGLSDLPATMAAGERSDKLFYLRFYLVHYVRPLGALLQ